MTDTLRIGKSDGRRFELPRNAATQKIAFLGRTGTGKSYGAMKVAEEMHAAGAQIVTLDPVGIWWGLRLGADGETPGIEIPVLGGLHGDIPLAPTSGELMADLVVDGRRSVILDVSQFESDAEKARFVSAFGDRFFRRMKAAPAPVHVFLEECQEFVPQNPADGEALMLHHWTRLAKLGRNFGIGLSLITQRPQEVNKKVLNMTELLLAFQMTGTHERKTIKEWLGSKGADGGDSVLDVLRELPVGTARVSSPQWLRFEGIVAVGERWTYDSSSTPDFESTEEPVEVAPLDLAELQQAMAATIEEQAANDPKALRRQIAELQAELRKGGGEISEADVAERLRAAEERVRLEEQQRAHERVDAAIAAMRTQLQPHVEAIGHVVLNGWRPPEPAALPAPAACSATPPAPPAPRARAATPAPRPANAGDVALSGPHRRILGALAWLETIGVRPAETVAVAFLSGYRPSGGAFNNPKGALRSMGLIDYPSPGSIELTDEGRAVAEPPDVPRTRRALHEMVMAKLPGPEQRILRPLLEAYPRDLDVQELAAAAGYSQGGGAFNNPRGRLRTLGLIDYPRQGRVIALDVLFPAGLR